MWYLKDGAYSFSSFYYKWERKREELLIALFSCSGDKAVILCNNHQIFQSLKGQDCECERWVPGPERWWTILGYSEAMGNCGGSWPRYWRANRLSKRSIGAKDSSNPLVAGFLWSFPQDSWSQCGIYLFSLSSGEKGRWTEFCDVEQRMRGK